LLVTSLLVIAILAFNSKSDRNAPNEPDAIKCDAEEVIDSIFFVQDGRLFYGGEYQDGSRAFSGQFSCRLGGDRQYGLQYDLEKLLPKTIYKVSVWAYRTSGDRGRLAVSGADESLYREVKIPVYKRDDGWELLQLYFVVPDPAPTQIMVYVYVVKGAGAIFFDDLRIENIGARSSGDSMPFRDLHISIDKVGLKKLETKKWDAVATGILITEDDDWVNAQILAGDSGQIPAEVRLKGDWLDHIKADKWSLRIKVKGDNSWNQLVTFSIQSPETRFFLNEWIYHQLLEEVDVLTPRYDFATVTINEEYLGVYAYEEHFTKQLVESKGRREGPILKLTEDGFWLGYKREKDYYGDGLIAERMTDAYWQSDIKPFKEKGTRQSPTLSAAFERAQSLLYAFKYGKISAGEAFDIDRLARYYAISDLVQGYHGIRWHNQRFYYNPVIDRLEPIGFDGYGTGIMKLQSGPFLGYYHTRDHIRDIFDGLFDDSAFVWKYQHYLEMYTHPDWLDRQLLDLESMIRERSNLLKMEFETSEFNQDALRDRARKLRFFLSPDNATSLFVRTQKVNEAQKEVHVINSFCLALEVVGYTGSDGTRVHRFDEPVFVRQNGRYQPPMAVAVEVPAFARLLVYQLAGVDSLHYAPISDWKAPELDVMDQEGGKFEAANFDFIDQIGNEIVIRSGRHILRESLDLPKGHTLIIEPGTHIDLQNGAAIIVRGDVQAIGTSESPIQVISSDKSASGFIVLGTGGLSELRSVYFDGLNTINRDGWTLTGGVTFHETELRMYNCSISNSQSEDALNTIRCRLSIDRMRIANTAYDGFDADFCSGTITSIYFHNTANDALDFSGSSVIIRDCSIVGAGDKGVSVGENSTVKIVSASVRDCTIAIASKDLSELVIDNISITGCKQGFTAYQKKPEFGPATIIVHRYTMDGVKQPFMIESGSSLQLPDRTIQ